ncbi:hypothetical protein TNCV_3673381 [Trichonephila clavipes]|nr:hypothetical protein TNCV_3673381 [Trichonephila clavipes]
MCQCFCLQLSCQSSLQSSYLGHLHVQGSDTEYKPSGADSLQPFSQVELNDLTQDLGFFKTAAELLGVQIERKKSYWLRKPIFCWYKNRE